MEGSLSRKTAVAVITFNLTLCEDFATGENEQWAHRKPIAGRPHAQVTHRFGSTPALASGDSLAQRRGGADHAVQWLADL
jgi:hypothetical protein